MKGILFKPDMIKAIVEGRKIQTRRVMKPQPSLTISDEQFKKNLSLLDMPLKTGLGQRFTVGEVVYIKEAWFQDSEGDVFYKSDWIDREGQVVQPRTGKWNSPMFLKATDARYIIQITDVRPERLQEITEEDAIAEGILLKAVITEGNLVIDEPNYVTSYAMLWDSINPKQKWDTNPWVWRIEFKKVNKEVNDEQEES